jgi:hypothetical protein
MSASRVGPIKIFVTDIDCCALQETSERPDLLSQSLLDIARGNQYSGMYVCTHRAYVAYSVANFFPTYFQRIFDRNKVIIESNKLITDPNIHPAATYNPHAIFLKSVVENFSKESGLLCHAVSTADDHFYEGSMEEKCGSGYTNILEKYESELMERNNIQTLETGAVCVLHDYECEQHKITYLDRDKWAFTNKNHQLKYIVRHALKVYGKDAEIELHFFDDIYVNCKAICMLQGEFPNSVTLKSFQHYPDINIHADINKPLITISKSKVYDSSMQVFAMLDACKTFFSVREEPQYQDSEEKDEPELQFALQESDEEDDCKEMIKACATGNNGAEVEVEIEDEESPQVTDLSAEEEVVETALNAEFSEIFLDIEGLNFPVSKPQDISPLVRSLNRFGRS